MNTTHLHGLYKQATALALVLFTQNSFGAAPSILDLADVPIPTVSSSAVKPNIMFILDNSGSMTSLYIPDCVSGGGCAGGTSNGTGRNSAAGNDVANSNYNSYKNHICNGVYYDPGTLYQPPVDYLGVPYPNATFTAAPRDGYGINPIGTCNLSNAFSAISTSCGTVAAYYYKYVQNGAFPASPADDICYPNTSYTRVTVGAASGPATIDLNGDGVVNASDADERQNFANWYTYYRTRNNTMKTAMGRAFSNIGSNYRVGFTTINNNASGTNTTGANFLNIADFVTTGGAASQKALWYAQLYSIKPGGSTPLPDALRRAGEYFKAGSMGYSAGPASVDPIQFSCQRNFTVLSTDGYWNSNGVTAAMLGGTGNQDKTVPAIPVSAFTPAPVFNPVLTAGAQWPKPFYEGPTASSLNLADIAMYYWVTDLRTIGPFAANNVPFSSTDPASWQHMATYTIGLANGTLTFPTDLANITSGAKNWPVPVSNTSTTVDDLWHAAVNGHGQYFEATNTSTIVSGLSSILNAIAALTSTSAAATLNSIIITGASNLAYTSNYNTADWSGDVNAYSINVLTGAFSAAPVWPSSAQAQLDLRSTNSSDTRFIATYNPTTSAGIPFQYASLNATQKTQLGSQPILEYLRGWHCKEIGNACGGAGAIYRTRTHILGDIVDSEGAYAGISPFSYLDNGHSGFKATTNSRPATIFVGANDGMLHAFDATSTGGAERWAYVPNLVMGGLAALSNSPATFQHKFYVDGTPELGDVDFNQDWSANSFVAAPDWRTIIVGGLNRGGQGFYAVDVTNPVSASEAGAAAKILWEFPNRSNPSHASVFPSAATSNVGFSYGNPIITKVTNPQGFPAWVVLLTSGYHNGTVSGSCTDCSGGDGKGYLYVLDVQTGNLLYTFATNSGSGASPSGLAKAVGYVNDYYGDNSIQRAYSGDLNGDLWRFNFSGLPAAWTVQKWATLKDPSSVTQPITLRPIISDIGGKRMVYVGTGKYLGQPDVSNTQVQSMWALKDDLSGVALGDARSQVNGTATGIKQLTLSFASATKITSTSASAADLNTNKGWVVDFNLPANAGERPTDPIVFGDLLFTTNIPNTNACEPGGSSWLYCLDPATGKDGSCTNLQGGSYIGNVISTRLIPFSTGSNSFITWRTSQPIDGGGGGGGCGALPPNCVCVGDKPVCNKGSDPPVPATRVYWREILN